MLESLVVELSNKTLDAVKKWWWSKNQDYSKKQFVQDTVDSICERACAGVRYQGKEKIAQMVVEYMTEKRKVSWSKLK